MKLSANVKINLLITLNDLQQQEPTIHKVCELRKRWVTFAWNPKSVHFVQQHSQ